MAERRRNHFVPRHLLNRFASRQDGDTVWVWQHGLDSATVEISTRDAAVSRDFYGGVESPVEDGFAELESRFGALMAAVDQGNVGPDSTEELRLLMWSLAIRTRAVRLQMIDTGEQVLAQIEASLTKPETAKYVTEYIKANFSTLMKDNLKNLPFHTRWLTRAVLSLPPVKSKVFEHLEGGFVSKEVQPIFRLLFEHLRREKLLKTAGADGHNRGLAAFVGAPQTPGWFSPVCWTIEEHENLVLGDAGLVAVNDAGVVGSLLRFTSDWYMCFLPLSPTKALVAHASEPTGRISSKEINRASAALSHSFFWSSVETGLSELRPLIGSAGALLSPEELAEMVGSAWERSSQS